VLVPHRDDSYCESVWHLPIDRACSLAFGATSVGFAGATWTGCSGTATASLVTGHVRIGPFGTSAGNRPDLSDERRAITFDFSGSCWVASRILLSDGAGTARHVPSRLRRGAKRLALAAEAIDARDMQKRANSARPDRRRSRRALMAGLALAFGATSVGFAGATWTGCSGTATASLVTGHVRIGPFGTSAGNRQRRRVG
jgi:hypothetical protein